MRTTLSILFIMLLVIFSAQGQIPKRSTTVGMSAGIYRGDASAFSLEIAHLFLTNYRSGNSHPIYMGIVSRINPFSYEIGMRASGSSPGNYASVPVYNLTEGARGICLKIGVTPYTVDRKNSIFQWSPMAVLTKSEHVLTVTSSDFMGVQKQQYTDRSLLFGFENEISYSLKLFNHAYLGASFLIGLKPTDVRMFNDVISNYKALSTYAPGQGKGITPLYLNLNIHFGALLYH